ncbi:LCP family protein [Solicola gregarius]|uniref:LCP family protein n=1 Tax=Solicola gregarius TaxID=2908642 RepID=A0AA46TM22_9ACTN|nr:LCP family protein [Solicola gregarius]UYM06908.1 LCP family protein [Solicola gregarius]
MSSPPTAGPDTDPPTAAADAPAEGRHRAEKAHGWIRRHKVITSLILVVLILILAVGGYALWLNLKLGNIDRFDGLDAAGRPDPAPGEAQNILLLGEDGDGDTQRADTIILAHITEDRDKAYLVSIPRDSYVEIYDEHNEPQGMNKINAAFSYYKEAGAQATVEQLTNIRVDHVAKMNWEGFKDLSTALDGVRVYIPETVYDSSQDYTWEKGWRNVEGKIALKYVRTRHGLDDGDFGRIARQQNFMRSLMNKLINEGLTSPTKLPGVLNAITKNLDVDDSWSNGDIRDLAFNMRGLDSENVEFLTAPLGGYDDTDVGSVVLLDKRKCHQLWGAIRGDGKLTVDEYAEKHKDDALANPKDVD